MIGTKLANATITGPLILDEKNFDDAIIIGVDFSSTVYADGRGTSVIIDQESLDNAHAHMYGGEVQEIQKRALGDVQPDDLNRMRDLITAAGLDKREDETLWNVEWLTIDRPDEDARPRVVKKVDLMKRS